MSAPTYDVASVELIADAIEFEMEDRRFQFTRETEYPSLFKWSVAEYVNGELWDYSGASSFRDFFQRQLPRERHYSIASLDL